MTFFPNLSLNLEFESCKHFEILSLCHLEIPASYDSLEPSEDGEPDNDLSEELSDVCKKVAFVKLTSATI